MVLSGHNLQGWHAGSIAPSQRQVGKFYNHEERRMDCTQLLACTELLLKLRAPITPNARQSIFRHVVNMGDLQVDVLNLFKRYNYPLTLEDYIYLFTTRQIDENVFLTRLEVLSLPEKIRHQVLCHYINKSYDYNKKPHKCHDLINLSKDEYLALIVEEGAQNLVDIFSPTSEMICSESEGVTSPIKLALSKKSRSLLPRLLRAPGKLTLTADFVEEMLPILVSQLDDPAMLRFHLYLMLMKGISVDVLIGYSKKTNSLVDHMELFEQFLPPCPEAQDCLKDAIKAGNSHFTRILSTGGANIFSIDGSRIGAAEFAINNGLFAIAQQLAASTLKLICLFDADNGISLDLVEMLKANLPTHMQLLLPLNKINLLMKFETGLLNSHVALAEIPGIENSILKLLPLDYDLTEMRSNKLNLIQACCFCRNVPLLTWLLEKYDIDLSQLSYEFGGHKIKLIILAWFDPVKSVGDVGKLRKIISCLQNHGLELNADDCQDIAKELFPRFKCNPDILSLAKAFLDELMACSLARNLSVSLGRHAFK